VVTNLLDDPCLQAAPVAGSPSASLSGTAAAPEVSTRELLLNAHTIQDLVVDVPTQKAPYYRQLLLPLVVDALGFPADARAWAAMFEAGRFSPQQCEILNAYCDEHRHLFELFDPVRPFGQVAGLRTAKDETKGSALLVATAATGNNVPLFSSRTEGDPLELTPGQAARWLLHTHCWDTAAIKTGAVGDPKAAGGKTTGNPTGPLGQLGVIMPVGRTVFETLMLNTPHSLRRLSDDLPQWRRAGLQGPIEQTLSSATPAWQIRAARGVLDLWTWQSRRIRLISEQTPAGLRVTRVVVAAGDRLAAVPADHELHTAWFTAPTGARAAAPRRTAKPARAVAGPRPRRHQPGRAGWRGLEALLAVGRAGEQQDATATRGGFTSSLLMSQLADTALRGRMPAGYPLQVELTGIAYGNQSAVIEDMFFDAIPLPLTALDPDGVVHGSLLEAVDQAEQLATALNRLSADLRRAAGSDPIPWDKGQRPGDTLLHALDPLVRRLLAGLRLIGDDFDASERGLDAWEEKAARETWTVADQVLASAPPGLFTGRQVTKDDGKEHVYRLSTAERSFRDRLDVILHRRAARRRAA
jgi:CRISPR system Cascade subunit CasA